MAEPLALAQVPGVHGASGTVDRETVLRTTTSRTARIVLAALGWAVAALLLASFVIFFALHTLPGDPAVIMGGLDATDAQIEAIRAEHGWDRPLIIQYLSWLGAALTGDFGTSPFSSLSVTHELVTKLQVTVPLALMSLSLAVIFALLIGVYAAARSTTLAGRLVSWLSQLGIAIPTFIVGMLLVMYLATPLHLPSTGFPREGWGDPGAALRSLILPAITLAIPQTAGLVRYVRSAVLEQLGQDYVRTARAQGMSRRRALLTQALRNAWLPLLAVIALDAAALLMGTVVVEQVFALPGIGHHLVASVSTRDIVTVQGFLMVLSGAVILLMMLSNVASRLLDPRVRLR